MKPRIRTILLLLVLLAAVCTGAVSAYRHSRGGAVAVITRDGAVLRRIDLSAVAEPYSFTVTDGGEENTVEVRPGAIRVSHANCRDQICVSNGWSGEGSLPIVCLPHRLVIAFERDAEGELDGVSGR
ncbi:MAG: NusG domain II-containing protein [Oscillospiraceae bacterium]|jgi:hypothetical protein|nr:NusG domain II-containing protein [Oscillospiraceae bacterium]